MKIDDQNVEAFVLRGTLAAIATHGVKNAGPTSPWQPIIQIVGTGGNITIVGEPALHALCQAIDYALNGPK